MFDVQFRIYTITSRRSRSRFPRTTETIWCIHFSIQWRKAGCASKVDVSNICIPFLFLLHQSGILYLHTSVLLIISLHLSAILNHTFSSQLLLPSHLAPAPPIRSLRHWRSINLVVCMYVCMYVCISLHHTQHSVNSALEIFSKCLPKLYI